ncbi:MAG: hypothetical protein AB1736_12945 [Chloroflexota bacterium]
MKRMIMATGIAALALVALVGTALAAGPNGAGGYGAGDRERLRDTDTLTEVLGLSHEEVMDFRQDGLSLAQIAERQGVDADTLAARLTEQARERIAARVENGALTPDEAAQLQAQLEEQVQARIADPAAGGLGGMLGAGYGPGAGRGPGTGEAGPYGSGTGDCDGSGPHRSAGS